MPDLAGCFPTAVRFDAYSAAELTELAVRRLTVRACTAGDGVREALTDYFSRAEVTATAGNAHRLAAHLTDITGEPVITPADVSSAVGGERGEKAAEPAVAGR
jgi:hypothetical protein